MTTRDALLETFLSNTKRDVFHSVEHRRQIWREDPFDVECVHASARAQFQRQLARVTTPPGLDAGRVLLLLGEAGSGKTHLVRAFRNHVHLNGLGFVGYMPMTTGISSYSRYMLSNLIDSLDQPYYESLGTSTGLLRLSGAIAARAAIRRLSSRSSRTPALTRPRSSSSWSAPPICSSLSLGMLIWIWTSCALCSSCSARIMRSRSV